jgi:aquaporin Z
MGAGTAAVGAVSGAAFNPAIAFGIMLMGLSNWSSIWIYLLAELLGALAAALAFRYLNPDDSAGSLLPKLPKITVTKPAA